jgi:hypothetical protein
MSPKPLLRHLGLSLFLAIVGCGGGQGTEGDSSSGDREQDRELAELFDEGREIPRDVPDWLPLQFGPVKIEAKHGTKGRSYNAQLSWEQRGDGSALRSALEQKCRERFLDPQNGKVTSFVLEFEYLGGSNEICASDTVSFDPEQQSGMVHLHRLGASGSPYRVAIRLNSLTWPEPESEVRLTEPLRFTATLDGRKKPTFEGIVPLPLTIDVAQSAPASGNAGLGLRWTVSKPDSLRKMLAAAVEGKIDPKVRSLKAMRCMLTCRDRNDTPVSKEEVMVDLSEDRGNLALRNVVRPSPAGLTLEPQSVIWQKREVTLHPQ